MYSKLGETCLWETKQLTRSCTLLKGWILPHFPRIHVYEIVDEYTEDWSRASKYNPFRGNIAIKPLWGFLDRHVISVPRHVLILWMARMWVRSDVHVSARAGDATINVSVAHFETPLGVCF